ncbi:MAPEG family protein [Congregibacter litoralis]|uniref:Putative membrane protein n=1 Tax=Congregibacter litoralis KT71 TaxID=314285 RepID=A4A4Y9_9GAMM|nr:MAPEG family protein [Congregibacter litoralis]EAQ98860.1 putative membrane protein [Congregibacter litoralis KT71]
MTPLLSIVVYTTLLTFLAIMLGAFLRNREWTPEGLKAGLSNRDNLPDATPLGGRAERAANNSIEALILFVPLALTAQAAGMAEAATLGATVFFWARVAYLPIYLVGIPYLRSLVWGVGVAGLAMMVMALLA